MDKNVPMLLVFLEVNSVRFSSEKSVWLPSPPSWLKYRYQASETYFAEHPYEERVDGRVFFNLKSKPSCWLRMPWLDNSTCPPKWSCLWPCPAALQGGHESAGAVQARPCCGWVAGLPVAGQLQPWKPGEAAATPEALLGDLIDAVCLTVWEWCEKRSNTSIPCNYLLYCVITCNCLLFKKRCMHEVLLKLFYSSIVLFLPVFLV